MQSIFSLAARRQATESCRHVYRRDGGLKMNWTEPRAGCAPMEIESDNHRVTRSAWSKMTGKGKIRGADRDDRRTLKSRERYADRLLSVAEQPTTHEH